jgi:hypothetical protein
MPKRTPYRDFDEARDYAKLSARAFLNEEESLFVLQNLSMADVTIGAFTGAARALEWELTENEAAGVEDVNELCGAIEECIARLADGKKPTQEQVAKVREELKRLEAWREE